MRTVKIGFSRPKNHIFPIFSWIIRLYEGTPYSHVYMRWQTKWGTWLCYHAASLMLHFLGESSFNKKLKIVEEFEFQITEEQFNSLMEFCTKNVGQDYAIWEVFMIPLGDFGVKYNSDGESKQYCAELVMRAFSEAGGWDIGKNLDRVKLKEVYNFVKSKHENGARV